MSVYVGLDCGGSSSRVMAVDDFGKVLFLGQSGAANLVTTPENRLRKNLTHATDGCPSAKFVCGCFAGLVSDEVRQAGIDHLQALFPSAVVRAEPDYTAAFFASPRETDICVISGTGSLVCSREGSAIRKSGGRGFILGDVGSAYQFGRDALLSYLNFPELASPTLRNQIFELFGSYEESVIVPTIYRAQTPAPIVAKLAKSLGADYRAGVPYAIESLRRNSNELASVTAAHARAHMGDRIELNVCLAGGLWKAIPVFRDQFANYLSSMLSDRIVRVVKITKPPLHGAVELARMMDGENYRGN